MFPYRAYVLFIDHIVIGIQFYDDSIMNGYETLLKTFLHFSVGSLFN